MHEDLSKQIFNRNHYEQVLNAERKLHDLLPVLDKAENCGIDCGQFRDLHQYLSQQLSALKREFMTPPPQAPPGETA
jgi:hypothetical protein